MTYHLVLMVRDEAGRVERCLESAKRHCPTATILDTGSTDDTVAICERYYPGQVFHSEWVNFGVNRSESLALAQGKGDWLVTLDADMTVEIDPDFEPDPRFDAYDLRMNQSDSFEWRLPLLLRGDLPWESRGAIHEYKCLPDRMYRVARTDQVRITLGNSWSPEKGERQRAIIEEELRKNPDDPRMLFYAAQIARETGDPEKALHLYRRRAAMPGGWIEEAFYSAYMAAVLEPHWEDRMPALIAAWEMRPTRLEPLAILLRGLNSRRKHHTAYLLSCVPVEPTMDRLFVHRWVWDWGITFERSIASWWVGKRDECRALCDELLACPRLPDHIRSQVITNRGFCE